LSQLVSGTVRDFDTVKVKVGVDQVGTNSLTIRKVLRRRSTSISQSRFWRQDQTTTHSVKLDVGVLGHETGTFSRATKRDDSVVRVVARSPSSDVQEVDVGDVQSRRQILTPLRVRVVVVAADDDNCLLSGPVSPLIDPYLTYLVTKMGLSVLVVYTFSQVMFLTYPVPPPSTDSVLLWPGNTCVNISGGQYESQPRPACRPTLMRAACSQDAQTESRTKTFLMDMQEVSKLFIAHHLLLRSHSLDNIGSTVVLSKRSDTELKGFKPLRISPLPLFMRWIDITHPMTSITVQTVNQDIRRVGLERNAVISVDNPRVSNDDIVGSVSVPCNDQVIRSDSYSDVLDQDQTLYTHIRQCWQREPKHCCSR